MIAVLDPKPYLARREQKPGARDPAAPERLDRERRMVARRIRAARFPAGTRFAPCAFAAIPSLNKPLVLERARGEFIVARSSLWATAARPGARPRLVRREDRAPAEKQSYSWRLHSVLTRAARRARGKWEAAAGVRPLPRTKVVE